MQEPVGFDLDAHELKMLTKYVASLPTPREEKPNKAARTMIGEGRKAFARLGCTECHVEDLRARGVSVRGIYSDLLLHDMGNELADPVLSADDSGQTISGAYRRLFSPANFSGAAFGAFGSNAPRNLMRNKRVRDSKNDGRRRCGASARQPHIYMTDEQAR